MRSQTNRFDRIQLNVLLIVVSFVSVLTFSSQSAASFPTYLLALVMLFSVVRWIDVMRVPLFRIVAVLLVYLATTAFWSEPLALRDVVGIWARAALVLLFTIALAECQLRGKTEVWLERGILIFGFVVGLITLYHFYQMPRLESARLEGLGQLDNAVVAGLIFGAVAVLLLHSTLSESRWPWRLAALATLPVAVAIVLLSGSRNAMLATMLGGLSVVLAYRIRESHVFVVTISSVLVLLAVLAFALLQSEVGYDYLLPRGESYRPQIWEAVRASLTGWQYVFGAGVLTSDNVDVAGMSFNHPHSMYYSVLFQGGLVGLGLFGLLIGYSFLTLLANYRVDSAKLGLGVLVMGLASFTVDGHELIDKVGESWFLFWLPVGIAVGLQWPRALTDDPIED